MMDGMMNIESEIRSADAQQVYLSEADGLALQPSRRRWWLIGAIIVVLIAAAVAYYL
jgi:hypothetical protein